eukprot:gnl/TRDRNA2_/TRDRNA2_92506_c0_seq2.p1 gnl/TRDRNA2_/TRDRNA2_92506_c0~~gnl/TRDRNA2_/TRDRNA2_92506_c0_seq2.p1  ORF type:complete len:241 (-),score=48.00 gnl/TRDRNA2_/TRDRNA2_92506_c0_seq2:74-712(-)
MGEQASKPAKPPPGKGQKWSYQKPQKSESDSPISMQEVVFCCVVRGDSTPRAEKDPVPSNAAFMTSYKQARKQRRSAEHDTVEAAANTAGTTVSSGTGCDKAPTCTSTDESKSDEHDPAPPKAAEVAISSSNGYDKDRVQASTCTSTSDPGEITLSSTTGKKAVTFDEAMLSSMAEENAMRHKKDAEPVHWMAIRCTPRKAKGSDATTTAQQ